MKRYKYSAIDKNGKSRKGVISAMNSTDLAQKMEESGFTLIDHKSFDPNKGFSLKKAHASMRDLIQLFVQMDQMQTAGVPLLETLSDLKEISTSLVMRDAMFDIHREVTEGSSLSEAMRQHPSLFSEVVLSLVSAGEESGNLSMAFKEIISYLKRTDEMQRRIKKATQYPMIVCFVVIIVISVMMGFVVPQITSFLEDFGKELPILTKALIATSGFFQSYWWVIIGGPIAVAIIISMLRKMSDTFCYRYDQFLLTLPAVGDVVRKINVARFAQTFGALFASGIPILSAIASARKTITNAVLDTAIQDVQEEMSEGASLSKSMELSNEFPLMVVRMTRVGEETGNLQGVLDQITEFYNADVDDAVQNMISAIEPTLTVVLGAIIMWIAVAVFDPIYSSLGDIGQ